MPRNRLLHCEPGNVVGPIPLAVLIAVETCFCTAHKETLGCSQETLNLFSSLFPPLSGGILKYRSHRQQSIVCQRQVSQFQTAD